MLTDGAFAEVSPSSASISLTVLDNCCKVLELVDFSDD